jgi:hypothetical protein
MFLFEVQPPGFAVISWARDAVKLEIGGPIFSQFFIEQMSKKFLRGRTLQGERLGVIGIGSIGRAVASLAVKQGNEVLYCDPNRDLQLPAYLTQRVTRVDSVEELMVHCDYVLGCSGRHAFRDRWPLKHRPGIKLLSASSDDEEFGPIIKDLIQKPDFKMTPNTWDVVSEHGPCGPIHIAYLGYPYSFVSRGVEALPTRIVQFETGGLLAALIQARLLLKQYEAGPERNSGIHRVAPQAQAFVYEHWIQAMKDRRIDFTELFGSNQGASHPDDWFIENSEPRGNRYRPVKEIEEMMGRLVCRGCFVKAQGSG